MLLGLETAEYIPYDAREIAEAYHEEDQLGQLEKFGDQHDLGYSSMVLSLVVFHVGLD